MNCPECGVWSRVLTTRQGHVRRRECANGHRFTTQEICIDEKLHKERQERMSKNRKYKVKE